MSFCPFRILNILISSEDLLNDNVNNHQKRAPKKAECHLWLCRLYRNIISATAPKYHRFTTGTTFVMSSEKILKKSSDLLEPRLFSDLFIYVFIHFLPRCPTQIQVETWKQKCVSQASYQNRLWHLKSNGKPNIKTTISVILLGKQLFFKQSNHSKTQHKSN